MNFRDLTSEQIAALICNSDSTAEAFSLYYLAAERLTDYKFIFASDKGGKPGFSVNRTFSAGGAVRSLFKTDCILVLDPETSLQMASGQATYPIDYSISLDTNAMSYLVPHMDGKRGGGIPRDFLEVFEFIARPDVNIDPLPYFTENLPNLAIGKSADDIFKNIRAYEILRTIDSDWLRSKGEIRSTLSDQEVTTSAQRRVSQMYLDIGNDAVMRQLMFRHQFMYACLLKMSTIQLSSPGESVGKKLAGFLEFCHSTLATMSIREIAVAREYFRLGQKLTFFGKIQKNSQKDLLLLLRNMAWDMWHVRQLEQSITFTMERDARYFFPALLTFDKKFVEIIDLYPLKACAFKTDSSRPLMFFDGDPFRLIATDDEDGTSAVRTYFTDYAITAREAARDSANASIDDVVRALETELLVTAGS
ncbi:hypothetical protein [Paraburkholderia tropica]|uniref:hypothetical protein n=1 Tax=Paraburkholderia tropica TaxID=92647 RepID=UPI0007ED1B93|nr:hypothetical protein [Paraburkholderia tropica]OBR52903.1 hypothetical protein A6456_36680 [Paraburkholderia tropica]